jgi:hypothetical protein
MVDTLLLDQYAGQYEFGLSVAREGKFIYANHPQQGRIQLYAETNKRFYAKGVPGTFEFTKDDKGKVAAFIMRVDGNVMTAKKLK